MNQGESWLRTDVARGHLESVAHEHRVLERARALVMAVRAFAPLVGKVPPRARFLDMGCGGAVYAGVVEKYYPNWQYHGFDFSKPMIDASLAYYQGHADYEVPSLQHLNLLTAAEHPGDVKDALANYDIVFASGSLEYCDRPREMLESLLANMQMGAYYVLHKLRLVPCTESQGRYLTEGTYAGQTDYIWLWHFPTLASLVTQFSDIEWTCYNWPYDDRISTIVGKKINDWLPF